MNAHEKLVKGHKAQDTNEAWKTMVIIKLKA